MCRSVPSSSGVLMCPEDGIFTLPIFNLQNVTKHIMYVCEQHVGHSFSTRAITRTGTGWSMVYPISSSSPRALPENSTWKDIVLVHIE